MFHDAQNRWRMNQLYGPHKQNGYVADLLRNYGDGGKRMSLPERDDYGYQRALEHRQQEKAQYAQLQSELQRMQTELLHSKSLTREFAKYINERD